MSKWKHVRDEKTGEIKRIPVNLAARVEVFEKTKHLLSKEDYKKQKNAIEKEKKEAFDKLVENEKKNLEARMRGDKNA